MPIRFRCVYCDQLLGIATRKAGTVVNCPKCVRQLIVPAPEPAEAGVGSAAGGSSAPAQAAPLFERDDFDDILRPLPPATAQSPRPEPSATATLSAPVGPLLRYDVPAPAKPQLADGLVLSRRAVIWLSVATVCVIALAFAGGLLLGLNLRSPTSPS